MIIIIIVFCINKNGKYFNLNGGELLKIKNVPQSQSSTNGEMNKIVMEKENVN